MERVAKRGRNSRENLGEAKWKKREAEMIEEKGEKEEKR